MELNGRAVAIQIRKALKQELLAWDESIPRPGLDVILVGDDPPSQIYVRSKSRACERAGIRSRIHRFSANISQKKLEDQIRELNEDNSVDGILLQLPLPGDLDANSALLQIDPDKDVDGLHPVNLGRLVAGEDGLLPCTPSGCVTLLESLDYDLSGKHVVVVGRSRLVGKPVALMLLARHATVTICHSRTKDLKEQVSNADVLVAAVGKAGLIPGDWIKEGAVVIDVGINRLDDGSLAGDVVFKDAEKRALAITPVPGGVGPMTIAMLLQNTVRAAKARRQLTL